MYVLVIIVQLRDGLIIIGHDIIFNALFILYYRCTYTVDKTNKIKIYPPDLPSLKTIIVYKL